ncbi:NADH-quinone oxidoreductase subunit NuoE [Rhodovibrionaceae bacterium A322]
MKVTSYPAPQSQGFSFTAESEERAQFYMAKYPEGRQASAVIYLLYIAQDQNNNVLDDACIEYVASRLNMAPIRVHEVASFYTMFNLKPAGEHLVQVCRTTHCWLRGSDDITKACLDAAGTDHLGEVSADGKIAVVEVECLGACCNAPMFQVNDKEYYEDLTPERAAEIVKELRDGKTPTPGSQTGRLSSIPAPGPTTLQDTFEKEGA